jgi:hypothetical protein
MDIVVVDIPYMWGMLLSRKFSSELGGTLEMDLTCMNIPLKYGTIGHLQNVTVTTTHVQEPSESIKDEKTHDETIQIPHEYSNQIKWPKKEEYQQLLDELKSKEAGTTKILKKVEDDVQICPSQQEVFTIEPHPPPSTQYTRVVQGTTNFKIREYKEGDVVCNTLFPLACKYN